MGMNEYKTKVKLDFIQDFEMMFERMKVDRPREAATYYTILIMDCPKEFSEFLKTAEELTNITRRPLETGRNSLLKIILLRSNRGRLRSGKLSSGASEGHLGGY